MKPTVWSQSAPTVILKNVLCTFRSFSTKVSLVKRRLMVILPSEIILHRRGPAQEQFVTVINDVEPQLISMHDSNCASRFFWGNKMHFSFMSTHVLVLTKIAKKHELPANAILKPNVVSFCGKCKNWWPQLMLAAFYAVAFHRMLYLISPDFMS